jgi:putative PIN family toxin of toxin-antitoxin system
VRAVLDVNVLIAALLSPRGAPAELLLAWQRGQFEVIVSTALLDELERALTYPKLRRRVPRADAARFVAWLGEAGTKFPDPSPPHAYRSADPDDDYLLALAASASAILVSGDTHLLELAEELPVRRPAAMRAELEAGEGE